MKRSILGIIIHFYFVSGKFLFRIAILLILLLLCSTLLIVFVPQFGINKEGFVASSDPYLTIAQVLVGIIFFISFFGGILVGFFVLFWFWPEIICELILKRKVSRIVQERKKIALSELAQTVGAYEADLGTLLKSWIGARNKFSFNPVKRAISGNHLNISLDTREVSWE